MKISNETLSILKNFSGINSNIIVKPGNVLKTVSVVKTILAEAQIAETFPLEFGIWDLNKFLATVSLFKDPDFEFRDKYVCIRSQSGNSSINYYYSDPQMLTQAPKKPFVMPQHQVECTLNNKDFGELQKASSVLQVPDLALETQADGVYWRVFDRKDDTSNVYQMRACDIPGNATFTALFKTENLKMMPGDYVVRISNKNVSEFSGTNIRYNISLDTDSKWG